MQKHNPRTAIAHSTTDITIRDIVMPLFRYKRLVIVTFLVAAAVCVLMALAASHSYESRMQILLNRERLDPLVSTDSTHQIIVPGAPVTDDEINSEAELLRSQDVLERVVLANGLDKAEAHSFWRHVRPQHSEAAYVSMAVRHLGKALKIYSLPKTNLISVSYTSRDPRMSYGVLNTLGELYLKKHVEVHRPSGAYELFAKEADKYKTALTDSEARLARYDRTEDAVAPADERSDMALVLANAVSSLQQTEQAVAADERRVRADASQMGHTARMSTKEKKSNAANILLQQLQSNLVSAQVKRTDLLTKFDATYPLVREVDQEIAQIRAAIAQAERETYVDQTQERDPTFESLREDAAKARSDLDAQRARVAAMKRSIHTLQGEMVRLDQKTLKQGDLLREVKANEDNYLLYLSKREQELASDALDQKRIANVAIAVPPAISTLPVTNPLFVLLGGLAGDIVLSMGVGYACEYLDSSFRTPSEVIEVMEIPVVIFIPMHPVTTVRGGRFARLLRAT